MVKTAFFRDTLEIPEGVKITLSGDKQLIVKGPNGEIVKDFAHARGISIEQKGNELIFVTNFPRTSTLALVKTIVSIINNLIIGVKSNYQYISKVCYSHFPCNVEVNERKKEINVVNFLGERAPRRANYPDNVKIKVDGDEVIFTGPDKEALGQAAANVKRACRIRKKDPRVFQDGVYLYKIIAGDEVVWELK